MAITFLNGTPVGTDAVLFNTKGIAGLYYLINYTKGVESSVDLTFETYNDGHPDALTVPVSGTAYFSIVERLSTVATVYKISLTSSGNYAIPQESPESSDQMKMTVSFIGGGTGTFIAFIATDNKYS